MGELAPRVLGVLHIADLFRDPKMKYPSLRDWRKIPLYLAGKWPAEIPPRFVLHDELHELYAWIARARETAEVIAVDTEFDPKSGYLLLIGLGYDGMDRGLQVPWPSVPAHVREAVRVELAALFADYPVVFQNAVADLPIIEQNLGIAYEDYIRVEDTMLAHACLWSEWPHTLEFLASVYGPYPKLKHLEREDFLLYNWGDVIDTIVTWQGLYKELCADPASHRVYCEQSLPLIPTLIAAHRGGLRVNKGRVEPARREYEQKLDEAARLATAACGFPINLGSSKQLGDWLYDLEGRPVKLHKKTKKRSVNDDSIAELRAEIGPAPDPDEEESFDLAMQRIGWGADAVVEARVLYAAAKQALSHYIDACYHWEKKGSKKKGKRLGLRDRIYPRFAIHAQASGRWSTTEPPIAQLPSDLRDIICPDPGEVWVAWDWDQIELRLLAALANDKPLLEVFANGWDVHTLNACDLFGYEYPPNKKDPHEAPENTEWRQKYAWEGKDDLQEAKATSP